MELLNCTLFNVLQVTYIGIIFVVNLLLSCTFTDYCCKTSTSKLDKEYMSMLLFPFMNNYDVGAED